MDKIGVDATGLRFNSIIAIELQKGKEINPLVNPGAIAAISMIKGNDSVVVVAAFLLFCAIADKGDITVITVIISPVKYFVFIFY